MDLWFSFASYQPIEKNGSILRYLWSFKKNEKRWYLNFEKVLRSLTRILNFVEMPHSFIIYLVPQLSFILTAKMGSGKHLRANYPRRVSKWLQKQQCCHLETSLVRSRRMMMISLKDNFNWLHEKYFNLWKIKLITFNSTLNFFSALDTDKKEYQQKVNDLK